MSRIISVNWAERFSASTTPPLPDAAATGAGTPQPRAVKSARSTSPA